MRKLLFGLLILQTFTTVHDCRAFNWPNSAPSWGMMSFGAVVIGGGFYGLYMLWQSVYPWVKNTLDTLKADKIAAMLFVQLKLYSECTPEELETKKELYIVRVRVMERLQKCKPELSPAAQGAVQLLDSVLAQFDTFALQQGVMPTYTISVNDGASWYDRLIQDALVEAFLLALKPSAHSSAPEIAKKIDNAHLRRLIFDKLLAKIAEQPKTPLWVARAYLVKAIKNWLGQKDIGDATLVVKALEMVNEMYQAREYLKNLFTPVAQPV